VLRTAIDIAPLGELADPRDIVRLGVAAEAAGWDGISIWDSLGASVGTAAADPFVTLAGVAAATHRLRLITSVLAVTRRRPQLVAQAVGTLDRLSGGRVTLGVGAGGDPGDYEPFGEAYAVTDRIARFGEAVSLIDRYLRGGAVVQEGPGYVARGVAVGPSPVQRPRPPIWVGGRRSGALRMAGRLDGWVGVAMSEDGASMTMTADELRASAERVLSERRRAGADGQPFDIALLGRSDPGDGDQVRRFREAGVTWWLESLSPLRGTVDDLLAIVEAGPPRV
jgi:alkanesulfonate monooxygenase SsuD/methylene tetrahydromethanopterin reductase-like flavin-dependent oxidoreductase (luciferase family)